MACRDHYSKPSISIVTSQFPINWLNTKWPSKMDADLANELDAAALHQWLEDCSTSLGGRDPLEPLLFADEASAWQAFLSGLEPRSVTCTDLAESMTRANEPFGNDTSDTSSGDSDSLEVFSPSRSTVSGLGYPKSVQCALRTADEDEDLQFWPSYLAQQSSEFGEGLQPSTTSGPCNEEWMASLDQLQQQPNMETTSSRETILDRESSAGWIPEDIFEIGFMVGNGIWQCKFPGCKSSKTYDRACDLRKHYRSHLRRYFCNEEGCEWSITGFSSKKDCERHQQSHDPKFRCPLASCGRSFSRAGNDA